MSPRPSDATHPQRRRYAPRLPPEERREQLIDAALSVIVEHGYEGVSIEAIARTAGVTRPVIYDHFQNLGQLLRELIEREERYALEQLAVVVPQEPRDGDPAQVFAGGVRRFLDAVASRPATWRIILLPSEGTPAIVREHVERNRQLVLERIEALVTTLAERSWTSSDGEVEIDIELAARGIRSLSEDAGRMVLTDLELYSPERYERFVQAVMKRIWSP
jgi:AcrR family transcriptional regulator